MTENVLYSIMCVVLILLALWFFWFFWIRLPAKMARKRGRDALGWVLLTWMMSPLMVIIILLIVGDSK